MDETKPALVTKNQDLQTQGFKTVVHKPIVDVTVVLSTNYSTVYGLTQLNCSVNWPFQKLKWTIS